MVPPVCYSVMLHGPGTLAIVQHDVATTATFQDSVVDVLDIRRPGASMCEW